VEKDCVEERQELIKQALSAPVRLSNRLGIVQVLAVGLFQLKQGHECEKDCDCTYQDRAWHSAYERFEALEGNGQDGRKASDEIGRCHCDSGLRLVPNCSADTVINTAQ